MAAYLIDHDRSYHRTTSRPRPTSVTLIKTLTSTNLTTTSTLTRFPFPLSQASMRVIRLALSTSTKLFLDGAGETERAPERFRVGPRVWTGPWSINGSSGSIDGGSVRDGSFLSSFGRSGEGTIVPRSREVCSEGATSMATSPSLGSFAACTFRRNLFTDSFIYTSQFNLDGRHNSSTPQLAA